MTIYSSNTHVQAALALARLNVQHPSKIAKALELLEVTFDIQPLDPPAHPELNSAARVRDAIKGLAEHRAFESHLEAARLEIRRELELTVAAEIQDNANEYIDQIRDGFDLAAGVYLENITKLPAGVFDAEQVANFTEDQAVAYSRVKAAAGTLSAAIQVCKQVNHITGGFNSSLYNELAYIADPQGPEGYKTLQHGYGKYDRESAAFKAILPELRDAVEAGCVIRLAAPSEATEQVLKAEAEYHDEQDRKVKGTDIQEVYKRERAKQFNDFVKLAREQKQNS